MGFVIRRAEVADAYSIAEMHVRTWQIAYKDYFSAEYLAGQEWFLEPESLQRRAAGLANPTWTTVVAEEDGRILGFANTYANQDGLDSDVGELGGLYVRPDAWNRGVGSALIAAAQRNLIEAGFTSAILWTIAANERTRAFYEHRGWRVDGATKPHRTGVELVRYAKALDKDDPAS